jgi:hypothetical protein
MTRLPRDLRRGHDDSIACRHRDVSCCAGCVTQHSPNLVDVLGRIYWIPDSAERAEILAEITAEGGAR